MIGLLIYLCQVSYRKRKQEHLSYITAKLVHTEGLTCKFSCANNNVYNSYLLYRIICFSILILLFAENYL